MVTDVFCDAKGIPEYLYSFVRDITHRKRAEEERQRLLDQLQQVRKMGAIETLAGGIAHEFNNVLGVILGYASLLKMKVDRAGPLFKAMDAIEKAAQRGSEFTHQMFSFARIGKYDTKATDLNEVVKRIIGLLAESLPPAHQTQAYYQEGIWPVEGDAGALGQALLNVCMNAREAMPEGGRLVVETENVTVSEEQARTHVEARPGPYVVVSVTDSGVGMRPDMIHRIFDPFFTTKNGKSAGMGLTIVYGVVKSHGGYITVESEVGKGSCFRIHLPAKPPAPAAAEGPVAAPMRGTETLLLAEDEELVRSAAADMLRELGYHVLTASNGKEAASLYRRNKDKVALVLMDVVMPGMTGQEACQALRRINPAVKILLSSGYGIGEDEVSSFGAQGLIHKPFRIDELATAVRALVGKAAPQR
jgi:nitrogen-specific signal transduction histidine kinase/CheY-like chemotaxis protein